MEIRDDVPFERLHLRHYPIYVSLSEEVTAKLDGMRAIGAPCEREVIGEIKGDFVTFTNWRGEKVSIRFK